MKLIQFVLYFLFFAAVHLNLFASSSTIDSLKKETSVEDLDKKIDALIELSNFYKETDSTAYLTYNQKIINLNLNENTDSVYISALRKISKYLNDSYQYHQSLSVLKRELNKTANKEQTEVLANIHELLTPCYYHINEQDSCLHHLNIAFSLYESIGDTAKLGLIALRKSGIYNYLGNYSEAINFAFEAVKLHKLGKNEDKLAVSYLQLGNIYYFLEHFSSAKRYYELSSRSFLNQKDYYGHFQALSNIGLIEYQLDNFEESLSLHKKSLAFFENSKYHIELGNTYGYLSETFLGLKSYDSCAFYAEKGLEINKLTNFDFGNCNIYLIQADLFKAVNNNSHAIEVGLKGFMLSKQINSAEYQKLFAEKLSELYDESGNISLAYQYLKKYDSIKRALDLNPAKLQTTVSQNQLKLEEAEFELKLTKEREKLAIAENKSQDRLIQAVSIIAGISILLLIFTIYFNRKSKELTNELIEQRNHIKSELELKKSLLSEIHHRVKNNLQIISSMLSLQANYTSDETLEKVIAECRGRILSMSLIHESLYKKIDEERSLFGSYVEELIPLLVSTYKIDQNKIKLNIDVAPMVLPLDESIPCGLIINEIVSNALKHAFPKGKDGKINIEMFLKAGRCHLIISDDGVGFPEGSLPESQDSFGFLLIYTLASQLEGEIQLDTKEGVKYHISWVSKSHHFSIA